MEGNTLADLFLVATAIIKDVAYQESIKKVHEAYNKVIIAEADSRRGKTKELIRAISTLDTKIVIFRARLDVIRHTLSQDGIDKIELYLKKIEQDKETLLYKKKHHTY